MAFVSREAIFSALYKLLCATKPPASLGVQKWNYTSRDLKDWRETLPADQPSLFLVQTPQHGTEPTIGLQQWRLGATLWIYYQRDALADSNPNVPLDKAINDLIDTFDAALTAVPGERQTLGGLAYHVFIDGTVVFDPGYTDPQAILLIPITVMVGAFGF